MDTKQVVRVKYNAHGQVESRVPVTLYKVEYKRNTNTVNIVLGTLSVASIAFVIYFVVTVFLS